MGSARLEITFVQVYQLTGELWKKGINPRNLFIPTKIFESLDFWKNKNIIYVPKRKKFRFENSILLVGFFVLLPGKNVIFITEVKRRKEKTTNMTASEKNELFKDYPDVVSIQDLQKMLHIGRNTAYEILKDGTISAARIGKRYIIPKRSVVEFISTIV